MTVPLDDGSAHHPDVEPREGLRGPPADPRPREGARHRPHAARALLRGLLRIVRRPRAIDPADPVGGRPRPGTRSPARGHAPWLLRPGGADRLDPAAHRDRHGPLRLARRSSRREPFVSRSSRAAIPTSSVPAKKCSSSCGGSRGRSRSSTSRTSPRASARASRRPSSSTRSSRSSFGQRTGRSTSTSRGSSSTDPASSVSPRSSGAWYGSTRSRRSLAERDYDITVISSSPLLEHDAMSMKLLYERALTRRWSKLHAPPAAKAVPKPSAVVSARVVAKAKPPLKARPKPARPPPRRAKPSRTAARPRRAEVRRGGHRRR